MTQTVPDISPLMPMHQDPLLVCYWQVDLIHTIALLAPGEDSWWRHQMETFSALLALCAGNSPVTGEFPSQRPVTRSFGVLFDLCLNKQLNKQSWGWWFETPSHSLRRYCNVSITNEKPRWIQFHKSHKSMKYYATKSKQSANGTCSVSASMC